MKLAHIALKVETHHNSIVEDIEPQWPRGKQPVELIAHAPIGHRGGVIHQQPEIRQAIACSKRLRY